MNSKLKKCLPFIIVVALELISLIFYNEEHSFLQMKCIGILAMGGFKFAIPMLIFNAAFVFVYLLAYNYVVILVTDTQFMAKKVFKNIGILFAIRTGFDILYYLINASVTNLSETYIDFSYLINSSFAVVMFVVILKNCANISLKEIKTNVKARKSAIFFAVIFLITNIIFFVYFIIMIGLALENYEIFDNMMSENNFMYNFISYSFYVISAVSLTLLGVLFINFVKKVSNKENVNAMV
ncbi:hypothetical protein [Ruminococcus sp.]|uniref:hypothetical protein n=1 Tax=Ruminococcus sp. TaxID=41978 RepID=UPI003AB09F2B